MHNDNKVHNIAEIVLMVIIKISYTILNRIFFSKYRGTLHMVSNYRLQLLRVTRDCFFYVKQKI
jgi:hypothetical protein